MKDVDLWKILSFVQTFRRDVTLLKNPSPEELKISVPKICRFNVFILESLDLILTNKKSNEIINVKYSRLFNVFAL